MEGLSIVEGTDVLFEALVRLRRSELLGALTPLVLVVSSSRCRSLRTSPFGPKPGSASGLSDFGRYAGLSRDDTLDCLNFEGPSGERALGAYLQKAAAFPVASEGCAAESSALVDLELIECLPPLS